MKKLFTTALALLAFKTAILAQTVTAVGIVTLTGGPSTPMEVAYNPTFNLYYASSGGGGCNNLSTWSAAGGSPLATISECYDSRGLWWNSLTNTLEGNSYNSAGIYTMALSGTGMPTGAGAIASTNQQPDPQAGGQFDPTTNQVLYYFNSGTIKKHSRSTGLLVSTITITGLPVAISNLATYGFYTGISGAEYAVYDYINRRAYLINYTTGAYVSTVQFPATAGTSSNYNLSYSNGLYFICNGTTWVGYSTTASALNFDGIDDYVINTTPNLPGMSAFTFETWFNVNNTTNGKLFSSNEMEVAIAGGNIQFFCPAFSANNVSIIPTGVWKHLAITYDGVTLKFYINGVLDNAVAATGTISANTGYKIGKHVSAACCLLNGSLDEFRIWNTPRTKCQINTFMNCEIPTIAAGLVVNHHFNQGIPTGTNTGITSLIDASGSANTGTLTNFALTGTISNWVSPGAVANGFSTPLALTVGVTISNSVICNGQATALNGTGANTYTWTGGVTNAVAFNPTVTTNYVVTGTNTLTSCTNTAIATITVNALPSVSVTSGAICTGSSFTMVASGANTYTYSSGSAVVTPTANANYNVTGTSAAGCVSNNTAVSSVTVNAKPTVSVTSGAICAGQSFTMVGSGASTYTFSSGSSVVTPTANANYNVTGTSAAGCVSSNTAVSSVTVNALPTVSVTSGTICAGQSFTMVGSGASTYTYGGGSAVVTPTANANYNVTGTSSLGCVSSNTAISSVTVNALPVVAITSASAICAGQSINLNASGAITYSWNTSATTASITASPSVTTVYSVLGTNTVTGCSKTATTSVTVNALPTINAITSTSLTCTGQSATLTANGATTYTWNTGATTAVIAVTPTVTTTYTVNATDINGCSNNATVSQSVSACTGIQSSISNSQLSISVYPNPSNGEFTVELLNASNVSVVDVLGKVIYSEKLQDGKHNINLINFNNGLYILKAESNGVLKTVRVVKQ